MRLAERLEGEGDIVVDLGCPLFEVLFADAVLLVAGDGSVGYDQFHIATAVHVVQQFARIVRGHHLAFFRHSKNVGEGGLMLFIDLEHYDLGMNMHTASKL